MTANLLYTLYKQIKSCQVTWFVFLLNFYWLKCQLKTQTQQQEKQMVQQTVGHVGSPKISKFLPSCVSWFPGAKRAQEQNHTVVRMGINVFVGNTFPFVQLKSTVILLPSLSSNFKAGRKLQSKKAMNKMCCKHVLFCFPCYSNLVVFLPEFSFIHLQNLD
jgi:hypothetical protein